MFLNPTLHPQCSGDIIYMYNTYIYIYIYVRISWRASGGGRMQFPGRLPGLTCRLPACPLGRLPVSLLPPAHQKLCTPYHQYDRCQYMLNKKHLTNIIPSSFCPSPLRPCMRLHPSLTHRSQSARDEVLDVCVCACMRASICPKAWSGGVLGPPPIACSNSIDIAHA